MRRRNDDDRTSLLRQFREPRRSFSKGMETNGQADPWMMQAIRIRPKEFWREALRLGEW